MKKLYIIIMLITIALGCIMFIQPKAYAADSEGNLVIVLDPGHGGEDPGAMNSSLGIREANVAYKLAVYAKEELEKYEGVKVYLTRYANNPSIQERGEIAKNYNADLVVSLHINSGVSSARGAEIWVTQDKTQIEYYQKSKELGEKILNNISKLGIRNNGVSIRSGKADEWYESGVVKDYYGIIRYPMNYGIRSILVEHCFISNNSDCQYIDSDEKIRKLALADVKGIVEAYGLERKGQGKEPVRQFRLNKTEMSLEITSDDPQPFNTIRPIFTPENAYNKQVEYYSSNPDVVRVYYGDIRGLKEGTSIITAISDNNQRIAKCKVIVTKPQIALKQIAIDREKIELDINEKDSLKVTFNPSNASDKTLYWESSNPDVVRVYYGDIRGLKEGTSIITATSRAGGKKVQCEVTVKDASKSYVQEINIEKSQYNIVVDEAVDVNYTYSPSDSVNAEFEWTSSNPEILRVYQNRFRGLKEGEAYIIARTKDGTVEAKAKVVIKTQPVYEINTEKSIYVVKIDEKSNIVVNFNPISATNKNLYWTSSNPDIVRVYNGDFRGLKEGKSTITVVSEDGGKVATCEVIVQDSNKKYVETINLGMSEYIAYVDEAVDIDYSYAPIDATNADFEWISSNPEILRVYYNRFRALKEGTAEVIARTKDGTVEKRIKVVIEK